MQEEATLSARFNCLLVVTKCKKIIQRFDIVFDLNFFLQKIEQSNFRIFWCQFRVEGVILDEKITSMTPIKIKSLLSLRGQKSLKSVFFRHPVCMNV